MKKYIYINGEKIKIAKETLLQKYFNWVMKGLEIKGERK